MSKPGLRSMKNSLLRREVRHRRARAEAAPQVVTKTVQLMELLRRGKGRRALANL